MSAPRPKEIRVVGIALVRDGRCLVAQRPERTSFGLRWEFPGGKVEPGEQEPAALARELREELGVRVGVGEFLGAGEALVGTRRILLRVFGGQLESGEPRALEHRQIRWCSADELGQLAWADADVPIVPFVQAWLRGQTGTVDVVNALGQPVGSVVETMPARSEFEQELSGERCSLVRLSAKLHGEALFSAFAEDPDGADWTYLSHGPFAKQGEFLAFLADAEKTPGYVTYTVIDPPSGRAVGTLSLLRAEPRHGSIEVGAIHFAPCIQRSAASTEAIFLLARCVFDTLGYRRLEWKCDALNERSRASARRLGFKFEGTFRKHMIYKGRSRDTAWYAIVEDEWPSCRRALEHWLLPSNFDLDGRQRRTLSDIRESPSVEL